MIQWGGSQNGILQKFDEGLGQVCLDPLLRRVIEALDQPEAAIRAALDIPGFGLTYASKLLRFLDPVRHAALDSQICKALPRVVPGFPRITQGNKESMVAGYVKFLGVLEELRTAALQAKIKRPPCKLDKPPRGNGFWRVADIEMALYARVNPQD